MDKRKLFEEQKGGIIDGHTHSGVLIDNLYRLQYPAMQSMEDLVAKSTANGIDWVICFPLSDPPNDESEDTVPFEKANRFLMMEVELYGQIVLPVLNFHPAVLPHKQCKLFYEFASHFQIFGLKLHPEITKCSICQVSQPFLDILRVFNWPLIVHSGRNTLSDPMNALFFAGHHPDIRVCVAHSARFSGEFWKKVASFPNVFVDIAPFLLSCKDAVAKGATWDNDYRNPLKVLETMYLLIPDRLIWGTDEPWTKVSRFVDGRYVLLGSNYGQEVRFIKQLAAEMKRAISWDNPRRLLGVRAV